MSHDHSHDHHHPHDHDHHHPHDHDHVHPHDDDHVHPHDDDQPGLLRGAVETDGRTKAGAGAIIVIRPMSGLSGDMMLAGLSRLSGLDTKGLSALVETIGLAPLNGSVSLERKAVNSVNGWHCRVDLPREHVHRTLADIRKIIAASALSPKAAELAETTFTLLAKAEGNVHDMPVDQVTFHEVGALDSVLDICLACALYDRLSPDVLVCGPLPLCDGAIRCSHGIVPAPAPAVLELLEGVPVRGIPSEGETVTPTAIALLKGLGARFGAWPAITVEDHALVYGTRVLPGVPNGVIFARGRAAGAD